MSRFVTPPDKTFLFLFLSSLPRCVPELILCILTICLIFFALLIGYLKKTSKKYIIYKGKERKGKIYFLSALSKASMNTSQAHINTNKNVHI